MIEQVGNAITAYAFFTSSKTGKTGLTVTTDIYEATSGTPIITGGSATALGGGLYYYTLASGSVDNVGAYLFIFKTTDSTVDQQHLPAAFMAGTAGIENLDALISSRSTLAAGAAMTLTAAYEAAKTAASQSSVDDIPTNAELATALGTADDLILAAISALNNPTAAAIATTVWAYLLTGSYDPNSSAARLLAAGSAGDPWAATDTEEYPAGSAGYEHHWIYTRLRSIVTQIAAATDGGNLTVHRGDTFRASLTGLGDLSDRTKLWFTVKKSTNHPDSQSVIQIEEAANLIYLNAAAAGTPAYGTITVDDEDEGDITIELDEAAAAALEAQSGLLFDIQVLDSAGEVHTVAIGTVRVKADVTKVIS